MNDIKATFREKQNPRPLDCLDCRRHAERFANDCIRIMPQDVSTEQREQMILGALKVLPAVHHYHDRYGRMQYV